MVLAVTDQAARYVWVYNAPADFDEAAVIGKTDVEVLDNAGMRALYGLKQRVLSTEQVLSEEIMFPIGGDHRVYEVTASPLYEERVLTGVATVGLDITGRRTASEQRALAREEQLRLVSHDLRQPLNVINLIASRLASESDGLIGSLGERIKANVQIMSRALEDILDVGEAEHGAVTLRCEPTELRAFLFETLSFGLTRDELARVRVDFGSGSCAAAAQVSLDRVKIGRVVLNLVGNALKFSPSHTPVVIHVTSEGEVIRIAVIDQGPGLDRTTAEAAFKKYWASLRSRVSGGKGLGLYAARLIVEAHGGRCRVDSAPGQGATFWFELPCPAN